jgi:hypothetical protein
VGFRPKVDEISLLTVNSSSSIVSSLSLSLSLSLSEFSITVLLKKLNPLPLSSCSHVFVHNFLSVFNFFSSLSELSVSTHTHTHTHTHKEQKTYKRASSIVPCDSRLHLSAANSQIVVFRPKVDEISLLTVNSSSSTVSSLSLSLSLSL